MGGELFQMRRDFYVYAWLRPCGTPFYIGKGRGDRSKSFDSRRNPIFKNIVAKMKSIGEEPVVVHLHEGLTEEDAFSLERTEIDKYGRREFGGLLCNMTDGGDGPSGAVRSIETRMKLRAASLGKKPNGETRARISKALRGRTRSPETRAKMSEAQYGRTFSTESRAKMSQSASNPSAEKRAKLSAANTGKKHTAETREKMSAWERNQGTRVSLSLGQRMARPRSGFKGVNFHKASGRWRAQIKIGGKQHYLGLFPTPELGAKAYDAAAFAAWGTNCYLNFQQGESLQ